MQEIDTLLIFAERCRTLNFSKDIILELDGGTGHKKPPRKGKKKLQTAHYSILLFYTWLIYNEFMIFVSLNDLLKLTRLGSNVLVHIVNN